MLNKHTHKIIFMKQISNEKVFEYVEVMRSKKPSLDFVNQAYRAYHTYAETFKENKLPGIPKRTYTISGVQVNEGKIK